MALRTDLALESANQLSENEKLSGIKVNEKNYPDENMHITEIDILTDNASAQTGKPVGKYITVKCGQLDGFSDSFERRVDILAEQIRKLCGKTEKILVAGLGNPDITPDAVGSLCAGKIFSTRHIKNLSSEIDTNGLSEISAIKTGVMGQTGIESAEQVKAICEAVSPEIVIAVDALACAELSNLGNTIQLCDTGISPGSGVLNSRKELSRNTLGRKCIAIGIPTVVDLDLAVKELSGANTGTDENYGTMMVTPRNIDLIVSNGAKYIAYGINRAFHKSLSVSDIQSLTE